MKIVGLFFLYTRIDPCKILLSKARGSIPTELILDPEMGLCFDECCPGSSEGIFGMSRSSKGINWAASLYGGGDPLRALVQPNSWVIRSRSRTFDPSGCRERVIGYIGRIIIIYICMDGWGILPFFHQSCVLYTSFIINVPVGSVCLPWAIFDPRHVSLFPHHHDDFFL